MAGAKNHDYHILPPSIWPLFGSMSVLIMAVGAIMWMHPDAMPAGGGGAKNKQGVTSGSVAMTARNEDGSLAMALPAGVPPDVAAGYEANFRIIKKKDDTRRRLLAKLAKKQGKTG
jgi:hypothetical protein